MRGDMRREFVPDDSGVAELVEMDFGDVELRVMASVAQRRPLDSDDTDPTPRDFCR